MEETERLGRRRLAPHACPQGLGCAATLLNLEGTVLLVCQTRRDLTVGVGAGEPQFVTISQTHGLCTPLPSS